jgi:hypothetical protein
LEQIFLSFASKQLSSNLRNYSKQKIPFCFWNFYFLGKNNKICCLRRIIFNNKIKYKSIFLFIHNQILNREQPNLNKNSD